MLNIDTKLLARGPLPACEGLDLASDDMSKIILSLRFLFLICSFSIIKMF